MADLTHTKVGDEVLYEHGGFSRRCSRTTVTRTTPTRVMIQHGRHELAFARASGLIVGGDRYSPASVRPWSDSHQHLVDATEHATLREWLRGATLSKVPLATLRDAVRLLKEVE